MKRIEHPSVLCHRICWLTSTSTGQPLAAFLLGWGLIAAWLSLLTLHRYQIGPGEVMLLPWVLLAGLSGLSQQIRIHNDRLIRRGGWFGISLFVRDHALSGPVSLVPLATRNEYRWSQDGVDLGVIEHIKPKDLDDHLERLTLLFGHPFVHGTGTAELTLSNEPLRKTNGQEK